VLLITKKLVHLSFVEAPFLRWLILKQSPWLSLSINTSIDEWNSTNIGWKTNLERFIFKTLESHDT
jgi:hypothetical protein